MHILIKVNLLHFFTVRSYAWNLKVDGLKPQLTGFETTRVLVKSMILEQPSKITDPVCPKNYSERFMDCTDALYQDTFGINFQTEGLLKDEYPKSSLINIFNHEMNNIKKHFPPTIFTKGIFLSKEKMI